MRKYLRGHVEERLSLGALGSTTLIGNNFDDTPNERTLISSLVARWSLSDYLASSNRGPVVVGVAHGNYTDAEVEAWVEVAGSWNEGSKIEQEIAQRLCRFVGVFSGDAVKAGHDVLNDGMPIKTKLNWILNQGVTLRLWAYNTGSSALESDPELNVFGHANLWPGR